MATTMQLAPPITYDTSEAHVTAAARYYADTEPVRGADGVLTFSLDLGAGETLVYRGTEL